MSQNIFSNIQYKVESNSNGPVAFVIPPFDEGARIHKINSNGEAEIELAKTVFANLVNVVGAGKYAHPLSDYGLHIYPDLFDSVTGLFAIGVVFPWYEGNEFGIGDLLKERLRRESLPATDPDHEKKPKVPMYFLNRKAPGIEEFTLGRSGDDDGTMTRYTCHYLLDRAYIGEGLRIQVAPFRPYFAKLFRTLEAPSIEEGQKVRKEGKQDAQMKRSLRTHIAGNYDKETKTLAKDVVKEVKSAGKACMVSIVGHNEPIPLSDIPAGRYGFVKNGREFMIVNYVLNDPFSIGYFVNAEKEGAEVITGDEKTEAALAERLNR